MAKTFESIRLAKEQLDFDSDAILRKAGWEYTCSAPGSHWLWQRDLGDGRVTLVTKEVAIAMQQYFNDSGEHPKPYFPEPCATQVPIRVFQAVVDGRLKAEADRRMYRERIREYQNEIAKLEKQHKKNLDKVNGELDAATRRYIAIEREYYGTGSKEAANYKRKNAKNSR